jgi:hypothetical protein
MRYPRAVHVVLAIIGCTSSIMFAQFNELRRLTASNSGRYSEAEAQAVANDLVFGRLRLN